MVKYFNFILSILVMLPAMKNQDVFASNVVFGMNGFQQSSGICHLYNGTICQDVLRNVHVFISPNLTMNVIEERLKAAYGVIKESKDMNSNCRMYALPSLCFSSLPICRTPERTNLLYFANVATNAKRLKKPNTTTRNKRTKTRDIKNINMFLKKKSTVYEDVFRNDISSNYPPTRESENVKRICREECELLENELCQKEYAIAKRHPVIGVVGVEDCQKLPPHKDCLSLGITIDVDENEKCYWENGSSYRGIQNSSVSGKSCLRWSWLMKEISDFPELIGQNYCRNPGNVESSPWCFVDSSSERFIELCDIPKCAEKIWITIAWTTGATIIVFIIFLSILLLQRRNFMHYGMSNIQNINTPSADKNIYGNAQFSSNQDVGRIHLGNISDNISIGPKTSERNTMLRISHFTLQDVEFLEELGEGAFGKVYKGQLKQYNKTVTVAIKALKENASLKTQQDFKREIELISDLKHQNIVCILGVVLNKEPYCMLFEYMANGDVHEFLISNSPSEGKSLTQLEFLQIALQISEGMQYLSAHHYVHRDLAARNCLVNEGLIVKISDFGLSRDIYSSDYYRVQSKSLLPVRWMPSESILYGKFTTESDVWSFGVLLWEIYSYGMQPYYGYSNQEVISLIRSRQLLSSPENCPAAVYALMIECWNEQSVKRPTFTDISNRLKTWHDGHINENN
ncbi:LOW QUALITY PROTEIN: tyrosine-protein kinase transmembrane receptor Ror [Drosophila subobscura]|uniref:LOW QUALITY PROTEIN: tyrosine-protein kinase transmembrane receptor Ror n=1 Tax=Drosophila subobscura TaxID=7241 RepID=UPI00155A1DDE|nr:LOW QUALITY PROTEIN: tyrosine-protein kinase transmembrane receptor Ror [Drosophila subobscura]